MAQKNLRDFLAWLTSNLKIKLSLAGVAQPCFPCQSCFKDDETRNEQIVAFTNRTQPPWARLADDLRRDMLWI